MSHLKTIAIPEKAPHKVGIVDSDSRDKTRRVVIAYAAKHPKYGKYVRRRTVLHVHDEQNESRVGDRVEIAECRPLSKTKSWIVVRVVDRGVAPVDHRVAAPTPPGTPAAAPAAPAAPASA